MKMEKGTNWYIDNIGPIAIVAIGTGASWSVAVSVFDLLNKDNVFRPIGDIAEQREEFYKFVKGKKFDAEGNEIK